MIRPDRTTRRGLTLVELLIALSITAMIAGAIASMMAAMSVCVGERRDGRSILVRSNAAQTRLSAYIQPSRCVLDADLDSVVLWLDDSRESGTVHATEIRWLVYDAVDGALDVFYVAFPSGWTQTQKDLADLEHASSSNWDVVLNSYNSKGLIRSMRLVDGLGAVTIDLDVSPPNSRIVSFGLDFPHESGVITVRISPSLHVHQMPVR